MLQLRYRKKKLKQKEYIKWSFDQWCEKQSKLDEAVQRAKSNPFNGLITYITTHEITKVL